MAAFDPRRFNPLAFDPTSIDLTDFDLTAVGLSRITDAIAETTNAASTRAADLAKDATYVTVGLGVLAYQRVQVRRREIERAIRP